MFWADRIAQKIAPEPVRLWRTVRGKHQHIDDMYTPSGFAHVGSLRGPILHDVIYRVLSEKDKKTIFTYVFNDFDPIDGLPPEFEKDFSCYLGFPLRLAPSPDGSSESFADYFASDFKKVLEKLGVKAKHFSSWDMYHEGKFNEVIKIALDNAEKIQEVYQKVAGSRKKETGWYPFQVVCPECKKIGTTKVTGWDGKKVRFTCEKELVTWATGCGSKGEISPFAGNGKLPWKVDWAAHWKVMGVTFEGAGKDHASRGGSYDIAFALCEEVFHYKKPFYFPYEFFLFGGKKMSSSKGIGLTARDLTSILPAEIARFLIVRVHPRKTIEFAPEGFTIPNLFDEFDRLADVFWEGTDSDLKRIFKLSQINDWYKKKIFLPRFRDVANYIQMPSINIENKYTEIKGEKLSIIERNILYQRVKYAKIWLKEYAPEAAKFTVSKIVPQQAEKLSDKQKAYLIRLADIISGQESADDLQNKLYNQAKDLGILPGEAFQAIYIALIGKTYGPKAAWFVLSLDTDFVKKRFKEVKG